MCKFGLDSFYYSFICVVEILKQNNYKIEWELPYELADNPEDISLLSESNDSIEYYITPPNKLRSKKITRLTNGSIKGIHLERVILLPKGHLKYSHF